ncbi:MAG: hypothetical protein ACK4ND_12210 [Cytophagaceae bacterium]
MKDLGIGSRVKHHLHGEGVVCASRYQIFKISFPGKGVVEVNRDEEMEIIEEVTEADVLSVNDVQQMLTDILERYGNTNEVVQVSDKWLKGKLILKPYSDELAPKEIPVENFFHKIVMLRDRLRVMEQKINSNSKLNDDDKIDLQQYITRIYGSLTTFNVLFKYKEDYFVGQKGEG